MELIPSYIITCVSLSGLIWLAFDRLEKVATDELRGDISSWIRLDLRHIILKNKESYFQFNSLCDNYFGKKHFSIKCFERSALISSISYLIIYIVLLFWYDDGIEFSGTVSESDFDSTISQYIYIFSLYFYVVFWLCIIGLISNIIPDYISLLMTRRIVALILNSNSIITHIFLIFIDVIINFIILSFYFYLIIPIVSHDIPEDFYTHYFYYFFTIVYIDIFTLTAVCTTFTTSIWLWMYIISIAIIKIFNVLDITRSLLTKLDIDNQPIRVIGSVASVLIFLLTNVLILIYHIIN